jgi:hypothetical protein
MKATPLYIKRIVDGKEEYFPSSIDRICVGTYTYEGKRMGGAPTISADIEYYRPLDDDWTHEEYVEFEGEKYYVTSIPSSSKDNSSNMYKHEITFYSRRELLDNTLFFDVVSTSGSDTSGDDKYRSNQTKFTFGGDIKEFVSRINDTMIYCGLYDTDTKEGYSVVVDEGYGTNEVKELSFEDQYITEVLQLINTEYGLDYYWVGKTCHVGSVQNDLTETPVEYGRDCELTSISKENSNYKIVDMITGYGSSDNLQWYYPNENQFGSATFSVKNYDKNKVSVDLNKLTANFSNPYNKDYYLSRLKSASYSSSCSINKTDKMSGRAYEDSVNGSEDFIGTLSVSMKFHCMANCYIKLSGLKIEDWVDGDAGIGCTFSGLKYTIARNGESSTLNELNDKYVCSEDGDYELKIEENFTLFCPQGAEESLYGTAYLQVSGSVVLSFDSDNDYYISEDDSGKKVKLSKSGISVDGDIDSVCATAMYEFYESQSAGIDGGYRLTTVTGKDKAATISVSGRTWILPSTTLMPSVYRTSGGAERFYYALNNAHKLPDDSGGYYSFKNQYVKGNPHQGSVSYDDIKPTINGIKNANGQLIGEIADVAFDSADSDATDSDSNYIHQYFYIKLHKFDGDYGFDLFAHALATENAKIEMIDCQGCPACSFAIKCIWSADNNECSNPVQVDDSGNLLSVSPEKDDYILNRDKARENEKNQDSSKEELWVAVQKDTSTLGVIMPNAAGDFKPKKGDKFVITGISLPTAYVEAAEERLDAALIKYMSENNEEQFNYSIKFSRIYLEEHADFASKLSENAKLAIKYNNETHEVFVSNYTVKVEDDILAEVEVELVNSLETSQSEIKQMIDSVKSDVANALKNQTNNNNSSDVDLSQLAQLYLSKTSDDTAQGLITFLKGIAFGSDGNCSISSEGVARLWSVLSPDFTSGLYGTGYKIDKYGDMEASSLTLREELSVPRIIYNEVTATPAEQWNTNGYGEIASVDTDKSIIYLKLEEDEYPKVMVGDICRAIFTDLGDAKGTSATEEGSLDDCGFVQHKGFFTTYFYVKRIIKSVKGECSFEYGLRSTSTPQPCAKMNFVQYGNFTNTDRQSSMYFCSRGRSYIEVLEGVNNWVIQSANRVCRYGSLDNLALKKKDGTYFYPEGNGLWVQDNVYFGGATIELANIADLDSLTELAAAYDVTLSQYQSVITVDDEGNVIDGLYTEDSEKNTKQYRISTAVFVRKGDDILLEEEDESKTLESGQFRIHAVSEDCEVEVKNGTVFVTGITNIKDGVSGTDDDTDFDYDAMRQMSQAMVTIIVDLEGQTSKLVQMPIRIQHDSLPFMVCSLSNESAGVTWNERSGAYTGFPVESTVSLMYKNEAYAIKSISVGAVDGITANVSDNGKSKVVSLSVSGSGDCLADVTKVPVTIVGTYAGANYEYTKEITISKVADGKSAPKAIVSDDLITIPTDSDGVSLGAFTESLTFALNVGNESCTISSVTIDSKSLKGVSCSMSGNKAVVSCSEGASLGTASGRITFKVVGSLDNASYTDYVNVKVIPNVTGSDGDGYEYVYYLSSSSSTPSKPSRSGGSLSSGWTDDPQSVSESYPYQYVSYKTGKIGADATQSEWSTPKLWNQYTKTISQVTTKFYTWNSGTSCTTDIWNSGSTSMPSDFSDKYPWLWAVTRTIYSDGTYSQSSNFCLGYKAKDGSDGADGKGIKSVVAMYATSTSGTTAPTSDWSASPTKATSDKPYLWQYFITTFTDNTTATSEKVVIGTYARGAIIRTFSESVASGMSSFLSGSGDEKYVDVVTCGDTAYYCVKTCSSFSKTSSNWEAVSKASFTATDLLLADSATINMAASQQVNILDSNSKIVGSFRKPSGTTGDESKWGLWLGGSNDGSSAPFRVDTSGNMTATSGSFGVWNVGNDKSGGGCITSSNSVRSTQHGIGWSHYDGNLAKIDINGGGYTATSGIEIVAKTTTTGLSGANTMQKALNIDMSASGGTYGIYVTADSLQTGLALTCPNRAINIQRGYIQGFRLDVREISDNSTLVANSSNQTHHTFVVCTNSSSDQTIKLPSDADIGQVFYIESRPGRYVTLALASSSEKFMLRGGTTTTLSLQNGALAMAVKISSSYWSVWCMNLV